MKKYWKSIKKFLNGFRTIGDEKEGFLHIKGKYLRPDLQPHAAGAFFTGIVSWSLFIALNLPSVAAAVLSAFSSWFIGYIIEHVQALQDKKRYNDYDAHIMFLAGLLIGFILTLIRFIFYK